MTDMTFGEAFVVVFLFAMVVSAPYWPKVGEWLFSLFDRGGRGNS
jgi:hypothetical protein